MWSAITPEKLPDFEDLPALLRYLQLCVHSCIIDYARAREQAGLLEELGEGVLPSALDQPLSVEERVARLSEAGALWAWLEKHLKTEQERAVVYGAFVLGMKAREILITYRGVFGAIDDVYKARENVLARLRRDPELPRYLAGMG
jgi:hypothetical protein